ncbi:hypothetical protein BU25DRAFT_495534 [Macroventuria anomochaeta]|uniref:Uncharacterized protein n=1 Tax=Macroventuria anomochaeta TaxID=301207 RepID=A0ACB6RKZ1_9PLEO|nr:uncharacterized protein BU25DRAFT_495534 [Macroventuria anomochaeta]KAF2621824.1 hypothetical protein BU25DRAFT_495534 [Macroventuria anomochaeta]
MFRRSGDNPNARRGPTAYATISTNTIQTPVQPTESTNPTTTAASAKDGLQAGPVAGIAVGMLIAGAVIAGLVCFYLLRRQEKRQAAAVADQARNFSYGGRMARPEKDISTAARTVARNIDDMLPQPVADDKIIDDLSKIRDSVKNHVRTFYHSNPIPASEIDEVALQDVAADVGISTSLLVSSLLDPSARNSAIRLVIGRTILSRCDEERDPSLLPHQLARLASSIPGRHDSQSAMYSKWKAITGALLQQQFGKQSQGLAQNFADIIAELDAILAPFVTGIVDGSQRRKNLEMILTRSANLAFLLFTQPGSFRFDFTSQHVTLVVSPALVQTVDDRGHVLSRPRVLVDKEVATSA